MSSIRCCSGIKPCPNGHGIGIGHAY
jgi:hypothetical protein